MFKREQGPGGYEFPKLFFKEMLNLNPKFLSGNYSKSIIIKNIAELSYYLLFLYSFLTSGAASFYISPFPSICTIGFPLEENFHAILRKVASEFCKLLR